MHQRLDLNFTNKYEELKEREKELKAKEAEIEKQEKAIEEQKAVWEKTLNSKLLAFKRQEQAYVQKKNKL